jgi:hypothetical protein
MARALAPALCALTMALAACGGDGDKDRAPRTPSVEAARPSATPEPSATPRPALRGPRVSRSDLAVIRAWTDAMRRGRLAEAARWFALPAIVVNGTPPLRLTTRELVRAWSRTLPCGARLLATERLGRYVLATFRLTERPGEGECGTGTGNTAQTAFLIRRRRIVRWLRVVDRRMPEPSAS